MGAVAHAAFGAECAAYPPSPSGKILVTHPNIVWRVVPKGEAHITKVTLSLNDKEVSAQFDAAKSAVTAQPDSDLTPGSYTVKCTLYFSDDCTIDQEWSFVVAEGAVASMPAATSDQKDALAVVNDIRQFISLPAFALNASLCGAAMDHTKYLDTHKEFGHTETPTLAGFTGKTPGERASAHGYPYVNYENVSSGIVSFADSILDLFDAPYHRAPFLQPGPGDFGAATISDKTTLEFGVAGKKGTVFYPFDGETGVPIQWSAPESPDPLRLWGATKPVGYIITMFYFSPDGEKISVTSASLQTASGVPVPCYVNTPANDNALSNGLFVIPQHPLKPQTTYVVTVKAATVSGADLSQKWKFTTRSGSDLELARGTLRPKGELATSK
ncbi:hypothetical protein CCAX7_003870 [Capsulimonas corticalis]|uniref:SCP domain-containing protein n=2 Tax=Capsulimonas corticalis TaxID=2219043 RepID=A0A402D349_9BACT|nr:hypothetical protein CCAX7_003870 [Capsulimonas corticalis]